jgi:signal transduction histidine kinase
MTEPAGRVVEAFTTAVSGAEGSVLQGEASSLQEGLALLKGPPADVLLATLRFRIEPRLQAAGMKLSWQIEPVPRLAWLNPGSALQILRMLQEVLTNIRKHSNADLISVATQLQADKVTVRISDNGAGFNVAARRGSLVAACKTF